MRWKYILAYLLVVGSYLILSLTSPIRGNSFGLSAVELNLLKLTFIVPLILIWLAGFFGATRLREYAAQVKDSKVARPLGMVATGVIILVVGMVVSGLFSSLRTYALETEYYPLFRIVSNYIAAFFPLVGIYYIFRGAEGLPGKNIPVRGIYRVVVTAILAAGFVGLLALLFGNPYRNATPDAAKITSFHLSDPLIILTILLPYFLTAYFGIMGVLSLRRYGNQATGEYRASFLRLANGLLGIVSISIASLLLAMLPALFAEMPLGTILIIVYLLIALYAVGYLMVASGARKLKRLAEA